MKNKMIILWIVGSLVVIILIVNIYTRTAPQFGRKPDKAKIALLAKNAIYKKGKFQNQYDLPVILPKSVFKILRMQFGDNPGRLPQEKIPSVLPVFRDSMDNDDLSIIWLGHSSVLIRIHNTIILTDPVFSKRASPVPFLGPKSFQYSHPFAPDGIPVPDIILLSHDHFDHLDYRTIKNYYQQIKTFYVPLGVKNHLMRWGVAEENITEFDWWEGKLYNKELEFIAAPAQHFSGRRGQNNSTLWCSWVITGRKNKIYYCGDSGYSGHFKQIGEKYGPFDITLMESGAYGKYWPGIHMQPEESVQAHIDLKGKVLLPIHWAKFNLAFHPWKEPAERIADEALISGVDLATPIPGQEVSLNSDIPHSRWWKNIK